MSYEEIDETIRNADFRDGFPYSLSEFIQYALKTDENILMDDIGGDLKIKTNKAKGNYTGFTFRLPDETTQSKIYNYSSIEQINKDIAYNYDLWEISRRYFSLGQKQTNQIAFIEDLNFIEIIYSYIKAHYGLFSYKFPLTLVETLWFMMKIRGEVDTTIQIHDLYISYDEETHEWIEFHKKGLNISCRMNKGIDFRDIYNFFHGYKTRTFPFQQVIVTIKQVTTGYAAGNFKDLILPFNRIQKYFILQEENPLEDFLKLSKKVLKGEMQTDLKYNFAYSPRISHGSIMVTIYKPISLKKMIKMIDELTQRFKTTFESRELDLGQHIILPDNNIGFTYNANANTLGYITFSFFFGIYPVDIYYADGGIGYYKLRLKSLCENQQYSHHEIEKWYHEIYDDNNENYDDMCKDIKQWINSLTTAHYKN